MTRFGRGTAAVTILLAEQPQQLSGGVSHVFVNGVPVVDEGKPTGALPGRSLRGPGYRSGSKLP